LRAKRLLLGVGSVLRLECVEVEAGHAVLGDLRAVRLPAGTGSGATDAERRPGVRRPGQGTAAPVGEGGHFSG
jgi:hypothetical protein